MSTLIQFLRNCIEPTTAFVILSYSKFIITNNGDVVVLVVDVLELELELELELMLVVVLELVVLLVVVTVLLHHSIHQETLLHTVT